MRNWCTEVKKPYKRLLFASAALIALLCVPASADETAENTGGTDDAKKGSVTELRDPFWPVGYQPKRRVAVQATEQNVVVEVEESTDWDRAMEQISIQGVSSRAGNEFYAIINGQIKSMGETVTILVGDINYTWMIENISPPSSVKLRRLSAQ